MTEPTEPPCFERRINAAERELLTIIETTRKAMMNDRSYVPRMVSDDLAAATTRIATAAAVCRDYARRPEGE